MNINQNRPNGQPALDEQPVRRTVIPTPRNNAMFPGWGIRF
jgi:hypothetical protein